MRLFQKPGLKIYTNSVTLTLFKNSQSLAIAASKDTFADLCFQWGGVGYTDMLVESIKVSTDDFTIRFSHFYHMQQRIISSLLEVCQKASSNSGQTRGGAITNPLT